MARFGKNKNKREVVTTLTPEEVSNLLDAESAAQAIYGNGAEETESAEDTLGESAEGTFDQPAAAQEVHGLGLHGVETGHQYVDKVMEETGKPFEEAVVDAQKMAISDKNYISGLPLPLSEIPEFRTSEGRKALAHEFAEESPELEKCLLTLWNKGIETRACCSGHSTLPRYEYDNAPYITLKLTQRASVESLANLIADYNNEYGDAIDVSHISLGTDPTSKAFTVSFDDFYAPEHRFDMSLREYDEQRNRFFAELNERFQSLELGNEEEQEMDQQEYIAQIADRVIQQSKQSLIVTSTKVSFEPQINVGCCVFDRRLNSQLFSTEVQDALKEMAIFNEGREFELDKETLLVKNNPSLLRYQMENFGSYFGAAEEEQSAEISPRANARPAEQTYAPEYRNYSEREQPIFEPEQPTYAPEYPDGLLRYAPGGSDVTYFYIPCTDEEAHTPYLQVMQKDGNAYINIRDVAGNPWSFKNETYQILEVNNGSGNLQLKALKSTTDGKAQEGMLKLPYASKADPQMEEFLQAIVQNDEQFLEANQNFVRIPPETRNLGDFQVGFTATQQKIEVPVESSEAEVEAKADAADAFANVSARVSSARGQTLETKERFSVLGQEFDHATQSIDFAKNLNMNAPQKISVISSTDKNGEESDLLISVTTEGSGRPLAVFREIEGRDDVVSLEIEPRLWKSLQSSNPNLKLPEIHSYDLTGDEYARFEIKKLNFSQTKGIETGEVNGANEDFALSFSALGVLIKDTVRNQGAARTSSKGMPNNIAISEKFIEKMLGNSPVCSIDATEPTYSQVLVSLNELNRSRTSATRAAEPLKLQLGLKETSLGKSSSNLTDDYYQVVMHSVPFEFSMPKGLRRTENLNIIQTRDEKGIVQTQVYLQLRNPQTNRTQRPRPYTLVGASVEKSPKAENKPNSSEYTLYMALIDDNNRPINVQLKNLLIEPSKSSAAGQPGEQNGQLPASTLANIASLKYLKSIAPDAFKKAAQNAGADALSVESLAEDKDKVLFNAFGDIYPELALDIYPAPANREEMDINSFNVVSSMRIAEVSADELAAQPQTETIWQDVIREQPVEQIPDPERPLNRPIYGFEDFVAQENQGYDAQENQETEYEDDRNVQSIISPEEETVEQEDNADEVAELEDDAEQDQTAEEGPVEETDENAYDEFADFAPPAEPDDENSDENVSEETTSEEPEENAEPAETNTDEMTDEDVEEAIENILPPGQRLFDSLDPNSYGKLSPEEVNRNRREIQGETPTKDRKNHIVTPPETAESKAEELFKPKEKKLLKIKDPNRNVVNGMIGLGVLATFLAYFAPGIGAIILSIGAFALLGAAALYGAVKVQNIIKEAINTHREKLNAKEREKVLDKIREMDKQDTHENNLSALNKSVEKDPRHAGARTAGEAIRHHQAVHDELKAALDRFSAANTALGNEIKTMQRLEAARNEKVDQYLAAQQNAQKAEQIASEAAARAGEMRSLLDKSEIKKLSKKEQSKLEENIEFFRNQTNQMNARKGGPKTSFSEKDYSHRAPKDLMQDASIVNGDLVTRKFNAINAERDAQKAKNAAQEKLDAARQSVGRAAVEAETAQKVAEQKLYENGFSRKADLKKTIDSEQAAVDELTSARNAIKAPVSKPAKEGAQAEKEEPAEKKGPAKKKNQAEQQVPAAKENDAPAAGRNNRRAPINQNNNGRTPTNQRITGRTPTAERDNAPTGTSQPAQRQAAARQAQSPTQRQAAGQAQKPATQRTVQPAQAQVRQPAPQTPPVQRQATGQAQKPATPRETEQTRITPVASGPTEADLEREKKEKEQKELDQELANYRNALLNKKNKESTREDTSRDASGLEQYIWNDEPNLTGPQLQSNGKPATPPATKQPSKDSTAKHKDGGREM